MKRNILVAAVLALAGIAAHAQWTTTTVTSVLIMPGGPKTRAQVQAELREAQRTGDILMPGDVGLPRRVVFPQVYASRNQLRELPQTAYVRIVPVPVAG